jgi:putative membrane protein
MFVLMISIILALIIVIFAVQNAAVVPVKFIVWSTQLPLVLIIFCSVFAGALLMFFLALRREYKKRTGGKELPPTPPPQSPQ